MTNDSTTPDVRRGGAPSLSARLEQQAFWFEGLGAYPVLVALLREAAETITRLETACQASSVPAGAEAGLKKSQKPLIDRFAAQAKALRAVVVVSDQRLGYVREYRRIADLLDDAVMFLSGVEARDARTRSPRRPR